MTSSHVIARALLELAMNPLCPGLEAAGVSQMASDEHASSAAAVAAGQGQLHPPSSFSMRSMAWPPTGPRQRVEGEPAWRLVF